MNIKINNIHPDIRNIISWLKNRHMNPSDDPDFRTDFILKIGELHNGWIGAKILFPHADYFKYSICVDLDCAQTDEYKNFNIWRFLIAFSHETYEEPDDASIEVAVEVPKEYIYQFSKNDKYQTTLLFCPEQWAHGMKFKNSLTLLQ